VWKSGSGDPAAGSMKNKRVESLKCSIILPWYSIRLGQASILFPSAVFFFAGQQDD
jgi:hypothetical protein